MHQDTKDHDRRDRLNARLASLLQATEVLIETYEATPEERAIRPIRDAIRVAIRSLGGEV